MYQSTIPIEHRMSTLTIRSNNQEQPEYGYNNRVLSKYDSYHGLLYREDHRRRLSSTGEGSGDSSTTTSGYSEKEDGSEGRAESEENDRETESPRAESPTDGRISDDERQQVETFFRGLKTQVFVSGSLANLYTKTPNDQDWQIKFPGIPVVILDVGEARSRNKRRIQIVLAERGTCFMLWRDTIDNLTSYKVSSSAFHTMYYSEDHTVQVGFSFDIEEAAREMWTHIERLVSDPENISLSMPGKKKKKKEKKAPKPSPLPQKTQISLPCCFQHVTNIDHDDRTKYYSLKEFLPRSSGFNKIRDDF
ncbi:PREDICTED: uncharacterized protein LOC108560885 [Nicrophorus vespilloides]|uniref:Uncharacterized protein LOC108560885 n=1 Tax=Nicrophorus vespilloides TaxID=110193 RepID=A0ABM1MHP7_NICVS|nr:PREDICTED: uncharacterized protein LOC108560885 [Nicrophorus vespilloides]XP_017774097.1 PREDICTED: uncharacterized protein LOC108560885 [Nicrophorus vespilloides]